MLERHRGAIVDGLIAALTKLVEIAVVTAGDEADE
jgi:hypothetical protein